MRTPPRDDDEPDIIDVFTAKLTRAEQHELAGVFTIVAGIACVLTLILAQIHIFAAMIVPIFLLILGIKLYFAAHK